MDLIMTKYNPASYILKSSWLHFLKNTQLSEQVFFGPRNWKTGLSKNNDREAKQSRKQQTENKKE